MTHASPELPSGVIIRPIQLTDIDVLSLKMMPNDPRRLPSWASTKMILTLYKIGEGIVSAILPSSLLYLLILFAGGLNIPINWLWIWAAWLILLEICIFFALTHRHDWLNCCWVVEHQGGFVAYAVLRPYNHFRILEWLQVHSKWRRKGIGSALMRTLISQSQKPIYLESSFLSVRFYTRLSFRKIPWKDMPPEVQQRFSFIGSTVLMVYST
ncbi:MULTISPECIES: GNAT family N-acetyltransferase [Nostocales]|uniref:GNAT family N-acetyltransferase n=3 Tax=Nostocales TaxID=1161 RepID=A0A0C1R328_9CYAN|nr:GNAT family N-acetyltransferase [Tolypothrix bouteillei]KAF3886154.1 GNAT family N-acetyltransferase [Tolypothrix bouteillei VB521301]